jgi:hypothetical protein
MVTLQLWCKDTANCAAAPVTHFEVLGAEWVGPSVKIPFGSAGRRLLDVVGWSAAGGGQAASVHVIKVRLDKAAGYLVYGGDGGVRILDDSTQLSAGGSERLLPGWGKPLLWVQRLEDLPPHVQEVVERPICRKCGKTLPEPASTDAGIGYLCERCMELV